MRETVDKMKVSNSFCTAFALRIAASNDAPNLPAIFETERQPDAVQGIHWAILSRHTIGFGDLIGSN